MMAGTYMDVVTIIRIIIAEEINMCGIFTVHREAIMTSECEYKF